MYKFTKSFLILLLSLFFLSSAQSLTIKDVMRLLYPPVGLFDDEEKSSSRVFDMDFIHDRQHTSVTRYHLHQTPVFFEIETPEEVPQVDAPDIQENLTLNINHQGRVSQIWSLADCLKLCGKKDLQSLTLEDLRLCLESLLKSLKGDAPSVDLIIKAIQALMSEINEQLTPSQGAATTQQNTAPSAIGSSGLFDDDDDAPVNATVTNTQENQNGAQINLGTAFRASSIFGSASGSSIFE